MSPPKLKSKHSSRREILGLIAHSCLLTGGILLLVAGAAATGMLIALRPPAPTVLVPNLIGLQPEEAQAAAEHAGLTAKVVGETYDESVPRGAVCMTSPGPGKSVRKGRRIRLYVSKGPVNAVVPDLIGLTVDDARIVLARQGLRLGEVHRRRSDYVKGTIVAQYVQAKTKVPRDTAVDVDVSAGPDFGQLKLPDGTRLLCRTIVINIPPGSGYRRVVIEKKYEGLVDVLYDRMHRAGDKVEFDVLLEPGARIRVYIDERKAFDRIL